MIKAFLKRRKLQRRAMIEILETLCTICLCFIDLDMRNHYAGRYWSTFSSHFRELKSISEELREVEVRDERRQV